MDYVSSSYISSFMAAYFGCDLLIIKLKDVGNHARPYVMCWIILCQLSMFSHHGAF